MKDRVLKYAIAIGDEWFTGFRIGFSANEVGKESGALKLLEDIEVPLALRDLRKCGFEGAVFDVELTRTSRFEKWGKSG